MYKIKIKKRVAVVMMALHSNKKSNNDTCLCKIQAFESREEERRDNFFADSLWQCFKKFLTLA